MDNMLNKDTIWILFFLCALGIVSLILSLTQGTGSMFYAGFVLWLTASYLVMNIAGGTTELRRQIQQRIRKRHFNDAMQMVRASFAGAFVTGALMLLVYTLGAQFAAAGIFGIRDAYLVMFSMAPAVFFGSFIGNLRGTLEAVGYTRISRISLLLLSLLSIVLSILFAIRMAGRGEKVGALLMNSGYKAVYIAAGMGIGISAAVFLVFLFLAVMSYFAVRYIKEHEDHLGIDNDEQFLELFFLYFYKAGPYILVGLTPILLLAVDYRIYLRTIEGATAADYHSEWGGFMGIALPVVLLMLFGITAMFTQEIGRMTAEYIREAYKKLRLRFSMVMRLSGYLLIPAMFFTFGAAKPLVMIFHGGLYGNAADGAVLSLKYMSPMVFLGTTLLITGLFYWQSSYRSLVVVSFLFGAAFEIGAMSILSGMSFGMYAVPLALDVFAIAYLGCAYFLGKRELLARCDSSWIVDDIMITFCAAIAAVPVILLNDLMTEQIFPLVGVIILLVIFSVFYVVLAIFLGCTDYGNIGRFPGGKYIVQLAILLGRASE